MNKQQTTAPSSELFITHEKWMEEAKELFGPHSKDWAFICPSCGHIQTVQELIAAGVPESAMAFSCIGRWMVGDDPVVKMGEKDRGAGCNYAGGGLFQINPKQIAFEGDVCRRFDFAPAPELAAEEGT